MKLNMESLTRTVSMLGLKCKKYAPQAMVVGGVVGVVASGIMACKATLKASDIVEEHKTQLANVDKASEFPGYSDTDKKKDTTIVYTQTGIKFMKLYGPAIILGGVSIVCILGSYGIMSKRNAALAAAYKVVDTQFKEYRNRVVERFGSELDKELRFNIKQKEIDITTIDDDGNEVIEKEIVNVADPNRYSDFAIIYDEACNGWTKDPEANKVFLMAQQRYATNKLKQCGHLFLSEVYKMIGVPETKASRVVGWIYDEKNPVGDNYVDFGIFDIYDERHCAFVNGYERNIILDFNVDGNILDLI